MFLIGACSAFSDEPPPNRDPGVTASASPPPRALASSSDGGTVEVLEVGYTVFADAEPPPAYAIWAVVLKNTSRTDLLAFAELKLSWRDRESTAQDVTY